MGHRAPSIGPRGEGGIDRGDGDAALQAVGVQEQKQVTQPQGAGQAGGGVDVGSQFAVGDGDDDGAPGCGVAVVQGASDGVS